MGVGRDQEKHPTFSSPSATFCEGKFQKQRIPSTSWFGLNSQSFVPAAAGRPSQQNPYEKDARLYNTFASCKCVTDLIAPRRHRISVTRIMLLPLPSLFMAPHRARKLQKFYTREFGHLTFTVSTNICECVSLAADSLPVVE